MGFFDRISAIRIKKGIDGRKVYFHWGAIGEGRIIPSPEEEGWLRKIQKRRQAVGIIGFGLFLLVVVSPLGDSEFRYPIFIGALFLFCGIPEIVLSSRITSRTATWPLSVERLRMYEPMLVAVNAVEPYGVVLGCALVGLLTVAGGMLILFGRSVFVGVFLIAFALWGAFLLWRVWLILRRT